MKEKKHPYIEKGILENLLTRLFEGIADLITSIAPQGFTNSPYFFICRETLEEEYTFYRRERASHYIWLKRTNREVHRPDLQSFEDFKSTFVFAPTDTNIEMAEILFETIRILAIRGIFTYQKTGQKIALYNLSQCRTQVRKALKKAGICKTLPAQHFADFRLKESIPDELTPALFSYVFNRLKTSEIGWVYFHVGLAFFIRIAKENENEQDTPHSQYNPETAFLNELNHEDKEENRPTKDENGNNLIYVEDEFKAVQKEVPPDEVIAYFDVFGDWPEGYPPKIEDYR